MYFIIMNGRRKNLQGAGFLSDVFGTIGNVLGTVGSFIPQLKPFQGLMGENSAYGLASKGLKSIGLGKKKKVMKGGKAPKKKVVKKQPKRKTG